MSPTWGPEALSGFFLVSGFIDQSHSLHIPILLPPVYPHKLISAVDSILDITLIFHLIDISRQLVTGCVVSFN